MGEDDYHLRLNHPGVHIGMTSRVKRQAPLLLALAKAHPHVCRAILRGADKDLFQCLSECALNILKGNITLKPAEKARLTKYRQKLRKIADKKVSLKQKHKIVQTGGFAPALLAPLLGPVIAPLAKRLIGGLLGGKIWNHGQGDAIGRPKDVSADVDSTKSCSPYHSHLRSGHASCAGQARSQWWGQSETLQPNIATLPRIPWSSEKHSRPFVGRYHIKQYRARSP